MNFKDLKEVKALTHSTDPNQKGREETREKLEVLISEFKDIFSEDLGTLKGIKAKLHLKPGSIPKFCKARQVPFALRPKVDAELERLEREGVITKVEWSDWASPIVAVPKPDGTVRLCGDFKSTVNPCLNVDQYPLPRIEEIFSGLSGGKKFSKIDLRNAYLQMEVEEESKHLLTINTHKGLYRYNRLAFGIASAPAIWQRSVEQVLQALRGVQGLQDDMLVTGNCDDQHLENLRNLFERIQTFGLKIKREKCEFFKDCVEFCGHRVDKEGLHKTDEKVRAMLNAPRPTNVSELRSFLGLINYYSRFLPNSSQMLHPLNQLLEKEKPWSWTEDCEKTFLTCKDLIASERVLVHYNPNLPLRLACDAAPYGLGCVLSHVVEGNIEKPIAFASRSLTPAEQKYSQIDKEALSIVWGVKKFYRYLFGRHFILATDHRPLLSILNPSKAIPEMTASRLQRYALFLSGLDYKVEYVPSKLHANADAMSRLPLPTRETDNELDNTDVFHLQQLEVLPVTADSVEKETKKDRLLSKVLRYTQEGWGDQCPEKELQPFFNRRSQISVTQNILMWGARVCIPSVLQEAILKELHLAHPGIVKMKALARGFVWWPNLDLDLETISKKCSGCLQTRNEPGKCAIHPWEYPSAPWRRIHVDFAGPFQNHNFFLAVDAHSKWPEVFTMNSTTTTSTISVLREVFSRNGIPEQLVSDNGPQFTSEEFKVFMKQNGIRHILTAPYHPATNGLAERFVQTLKNSLQAMVSEEGSMQKKLANCLFAYRNTPHTTTGQSPAQLFLRRELRSRLSLLRPSVRKVVENQTMKESLQSNAPNRCFEVGSSVATRNYRPGPKWTPGVISSQQGPRSYTVKVDDGVHWRRHSDQIISSPMLEEAQDKDVSKSTTDITKECLEPYNISELSSPVKSPEIANTPRYPRRERKAPKRLGI